jgi:hypothetical protein
MERIEKKLTATGWLVKWNLHAIRNILESRQS